MKYLDFIKQEMAVIMDRDPAIKSKMEVFLYPSFWALLKYRKAHKLYKKGHFYRARKLSQRTARKTGIEIHPGATIGEGLFIAHGHGVVIGETAIIGDNVTLYQGVTLGGTGKEQGKRHNDALDKICGGCGKESAKCCIADDDQCTDDHGYLINVPEQAGKKLSAGGKTGSGIRHKENHDHNCRNCHQCMAFITVSVFEKSRQRDGIVCFVGITAQAFCNDQPGEIGTDCKPDRSPAGLSTTGKIRNTGQSHQKPAAHVRCFRTHCSYNRPEFTATQIKIRNIIVLLGIEYTNANHQDQINDHDEKQSYCLSCHNKTLLCLFI